MRCAFGRSRLETPLMWAYVDTLIRFEMRSNSATVTRPRRTHSRSSYVVIIKIFAVVFSRGERIGVALLCPNLDAPTTRRRRPPSDFVDVRIHIRASRREYICERGVVSPYRILMEHMSDQYRGDPPRKFLI